MHRNNLKNVALFGIGLLLTAGDTPAHTGFWPLGHAYISPRVSINTLILQQALDEPSPGQGTDAATRSLQAELAARQPLALAYTLLNKKPQEAAVFLLEDIPDQQKWRVLKKLPPQAIAKILDAMEIATAGRIIQLMRPLNAGLTLNAMREGRAVFSALPQKFRGILLKTPGPRTIVHPTIEAADFHRGGGLGDVIKYLPRETAEQGDVPYVVMPLWKGIGRENLTPEGTISIPMKNAYGGDWQAEVRIFSAVVGEIITYKVYFLENKNFFDVDQEGFYTGEAVDERFVLFNKAVLEALRHLDVKPDIIHCHEWQTGLIPAYLKAFYQADPKINFFNKTIALHTVHNPLYDKKFPENNFKVTGLKEHPYLGALKSGLEWSFTKAGLIYAKASSIVGKRIATDVQRNDYAGLMDVYRQLAKQGRWIAILNGENSDFRAEVNKNIAVKFDVAHLDLRFHNKEALQRNLGLEVNRKKPVIGMIGRLTDQKGYDILLPIIRDILGNDAQFVSLGRAGKSEKIDPDGWKLQKKFEALIKEINTNPEDEKFRKQISMNFEFGKNFDDGTTLEALICSGADIILVPSKFEPFGLVVLNAAGCGAVPLAEFIQGPADTIKPVDPETGEGTGFLFEGHSSVGLKNKIFEAIDLYRNKPKIWRRIQANNMNADFSWDPVYWQYRDTMYSRVRHTPPVLSPGFFDTSPRAKKMSQAIDGTDIAGQSI